MNLLILGQAGEGIDGSAAQAMTLVLAASGYPLERRYRQVELSGLALFVLPVLNQIIDNGRISQS